MKRKNEFLNMHIYQNIAPQLLNVLEYFSKKHTEKSKQNVWVDETIEPPKTQNCKDENRIWHSIY